MTTKSVVARPRTALPHTGILHFGAWRLLRRRLLMVAEWAFVVLAAGSVAIQWLHPSGQALPFMSVGGLEVGGKSQAAIAQELQQYAISGEVIVTTPSKSWRTSWQGIGITIDPDASAAAAVEYKWWERSLPFSSVAKAWQSHSLPLVALKDTERLKAFAGQVAAEDTASAEAAVVNVQQGVVHTDLTKNSYILSLPEVERQLQASAVAVDTVIDIRPSGTQQRFSLESVARAHAAAEAILSHRVTLKTADANFVVPRATIGGWLRCNRDAVTQDLMVNVDQTAVQQYLQNLNTSLAVEPQTSIVTLLNELEISRTPAVSGRSVAVDDSVARIRAALISPAQEVVVPLQVATVPPRISYVRTYSQNSQGLQAIVNDWRRSYGSNYAVTVREIGGQYRNAEADPNRSLVTASTFKVFVYYAVAKKIDEGKIGYGTPIGGGRHTVEQCLEKMIVVSDNGCAVSLMNVLGWAETQRVVAAAGFNGTSLNNQGGGSDKYTTPHDLAQFMFRLQRGELLGQETTNRLIGYMKRQIWRTSIPVGLPRGIPVANKVGFYDGWVHDAAIIYSPKATYVLVVMSRGGTDPAMADLSRRVYGFFQN